MPTITICFNHVPLPIRKETGLKMLKSLIEAGFKVRAIWSYYFVEIELFF